MNSLSCLVILRPKQWIKNLIIFFPPFLSGSIHTSAYNLIIGLISFVSFCLVSSALYVANDIRDTERDSFHPTKCLRPLPSGKMSKLLAILIAILVGAIGLALAYFSVNSLVPYLLLYCAVITVYTTWLKKMPVIDLFCISCGFLIRLQAGGEVFQVDISEWLFLSVFFLALFLSTGKRLSEKTLLGVAAVEHRSSLDGYPVGVLDSILQVSSATVLVTYTMYTLAHPHLVYTVPLCTFGLFRYMLRVKSGNNGDPTESLLNDIPLLCVSVLWALLVGWSIYR